MNLQFRYLLLITFLFCGIVHCYSQNKNNNEQVSAAPIDGVRIAWDYSSMRQLADKGGYPRLLRLQDNSLIVVYDAPSGNSALIRSYDNGATWSQPIITFNQFTYTDSRGESTLVNMANAEIYQLANGDIILGCNYRPAKAEIAPYSIVVKRSTDNGTTWHEAQVVYNAAPRFTDGCWEPSFLQLPDGELQVYFANENPYLQSDEQEISMLSSGNNGLTWTAEPKTVSFRKDRRDGMPVSRIIKDEIVMVIEDNKADQFKPYTVRTKIADNWANVVLADSPNRNYALSEIIPDNVYMGAPYLLKLPTGETLISYQSTENRSSDWELSTMQVAIGDKDARNFDKRTEPFDLPLTKQAKWNSLALWDSNTVVAMASTDFNSIHISPWMIKGYVIPEIVAEGKEIKEYPLFVGAKGNTNLRVGVGADTDNLYLKCKIQNASFSDKDGVYIYIDSQKASASAPNKGIYKLWSDRKGKTELMEGKNGSWKTIVPALPIKVLSFNNLDGYELSLVIPKKSIPPFSEKEIRLCLALSVGTSYVEAMTNSRLDAPNTWLKIKF